MAALSESSVSDRSGPKDDDGLTENKPAFPGAKIDNRGCCVRHPDVQLQERMFDKWHVIRKRCPECPGRVEGGGREQDGGKGGSRDPSMLGLYAAIFDE